ncbi:MAG: phage holin family protein [Myxococcota bacterium]|jgi:putative membrane protein
MLEFAVQWVISAALLLVMSSLVRDVEVEGWGTAFVGALVLALANAFVRPLLILFTLPLTLLTLGLFLLVVNAMVLWLVGALVPGIRVKSFWGAFVGSLLLSLLNFAVYAIL